MHRDLPQDLAQQGWHCLPQLPALLHWSEAHLQAAHACMKDPSNKHWWRYQSTWFAGVNVLANNATGAAGAKPSLPEELLSALTGYCQADTQALDQGQISAIYPGYPQADTLQSEQAHYFRQRHYAAHLDGLVPQGTGRRRFLTEQHSFILGISLTDHPANAAPLMVWPGSHQRIQAWLQTTLGTESSTKWANIDLTDEYQQIRRQILEDTEPQALYLAKGEAYVLHRHLLHGMGLWPKSIEDPRHQGRIITYFRPCWHEPENWLFGP